MNPKKPEPPFGKTRPCTRPPVAAAQPYLRLCPACHRAYPAEATRCELDDCRLHRVCFSPRGPQAGQVLGDFELVSRLALGASSEVWEGLRRADGLPVILKLLRFFTHDMDAVADLCSRFFREAAAVSAIGHPHIVRLLDHGLDTDTGQAYLVFERLSGRTMQEVLRGWRMPRDLGTGLDVARQIASGMEQVHRLGIIHRDLKPSNVFLEDTAAGPHVKILDFGLAKIRNTPHLATLTRDMMYGTPAYLAPEQARGEEPGEASDVYGLGVMLFEMFTGKLPFLGTPMQMIAAHLHKPPPDPLRLQPGLPRELGDLILRCLQKSASQRYPDMASLAASLAAIPTPLPDPIPGPDHDRP
jgi:eukaryotic-like serine/threonine-protein kinase